MKPIFSAVCRGSSHARCLRFHAEAEQSAPRGRKARDLAYPTFFNALSCTILFSKWQYGCMMSWPGAIA